MPEQLNFHNSLARRTDPQTSHEAAEEIKEHLPHLEQLVLDAIRRSENGLTIDELTVQLGLDKVTISPRIKPLTVKGKIFSDGTKRAGRSGRKGLVWRRK